MPASVVWVLAVHIAGAGGHVQTLQFAMQSEHMCEEIAATSRNAKCLEVEAPQGSFGVRGFGTGPVPKPKPGWKP